MFFVAELLKFVFGILRHTGTKLVAVSLFTPSQNTSSEPNSSATASSATDKASSSAGPAEKQELTSGKDKGSLKNGTEVRVCCEDLF